MDYQEGQGKVQHKCRTCLTGGKNMKSLLENSHEMKKLLIKFNAVTKIQIPPNSMYPAYICNICEEKVITFFEFQQNYRTSNDIICAYIQNISENQIKVEDNSIDYPYEMFASQPEARPISKLAEKFSESDQNGSDTLDNANFESHSDLNDINESNIVKRESFESNNDVIKNDIPHYLNLETKNHLNNTNVSKNVNVERASSKINEGMRIKTGRHKFKIDERVHTRGRAYVCNICGKDFPGPDTLTKHKHFCKIFDCKICGRRYSSRHQLRIHIKEHMVDYQTEAKNSEGHSATNISGLINTNADINVTELNLKDQIEIYERGVKIEERSTILQPTKLPKSKALEKYPKKIIDNAIIMVKKRYFHVNCICCQYVSIDNNKLALHMLNFHRKLVTTWCSLCNQVFDDLEKHKNPVYFKHFECPLCKYMCNKFSILIRHLNSHLDEKRFKCDVCGMRFQVRNTFYLHKLRKHPSHTENMDGTSEFTNSENSDVVSNDPVENQSNIGITEIGISCSQSNEDVIPRIEGWQCQSSCTSSKMEKYITVNTGNYQTENSESHSTTNISGLINTNDKINVELNLKGQIEPYVKIQEISTILQPTKLSKKRLVKKYPKELIDNAVIIIRKKYLHVNCIYCQYVGEGKRQLISHMIHHHRKFMRSWCPSCNQAFDDIEKHSNPANFQHFECPLCKYMCNKYSYLVTHLNGHLDEKRFHCDVCGTRYGSYNSLNLHILRKHPSYRKCTDGTSKIFNSDNSVVVNNDPIETKPNIGIAELGVSCSQSNEGTIPIIEGGQCKPSCSSVTSNKMVECITVNTGNCLTEEINTNAENNVELDLKDEIEIYEHSVKIEERSTILQLIRLPKNRALKKYPKEVIANAISKVRKKYLRVNCIYCQFVGVNKKDLVYHMADLHRKFFTNWCSSCNQVFDNLKKHKGHNKFECPLCTCMYGTQNNLIYHLNRHLDEKRFKCAFCGTRFQDIKTLYLHIQRKHPRHAKNASGTSEITNSENGHVVTNDPIGIAEIGISCSQSNGDMIEGWQCKPSCSSITSNKMGGCITVNTGKNDIEEKNNESHSTTYTTSENSKMELISVVGDKI